jgi:hypothetical protein
MAGLAVQDMTNVGIPHPATRMSLHSMLTDAELPGVLQVLVV